MIDRQNLIGTAGAHFSDDELYRYLLWRRWGPADAKIWSFMNFIMLNPSTADENANDPTVERCERRARAMGFDGLYVTNIFAWRSTDPSGLYDLPDPTGIENNRVLIQTARASALIVCAWGNHGHLGGRGATVRGLLERYTRHALHTLKVSKAGQPWPPLYVGYDVQPMPWDRAA